LVVGCWALNSSGPNATSGSDSALGELTGCPSNLAILSRTFWGMRTMFRRSVAASCVTIAGSLLLAAPAWATWSVDGVDPATGEVGVAVASCVPADVGRVAVVVPGKGAGSSQAKINRASGGPMAEAIATATSPEAVIEAVTSSTFDADSASRQFGVVLLGKGGDGFTGAKNMDVAVDRRNGRGTVSVQGNILVSEKVVDDAVATFDRTDGPLAQKLLAALEAGSKAGGDSRCGKQTASSATLIVAKPGDPVWAHTDAPAFGDPAKGATVPSTYVSVVNRRGGANPVEGLVAAYQSATPVNGKINVRKVQFGGEAAHPVIVFGVLGAIGLVVAGAVVAVVVLSKRRARRRTAEQVEVDEMSVSELMSTVAADTTPDVED